MACHEPEFLLQSWVGLLYAAVIALEQAILAEANACSERRKNVAQEFHCIQFYIILYVEIQILQVSISE